MQQCAINVVIGKFKSIERQRGFVTHVLQQDEVFFWIIEGKLARQPIQNIYAKTVKRSPFVNAWTTDDI